MTSNLRPKSIGRLASDLVAASSEDQLVVPVGGGTHRAIGYPVHGDVDVGILWGPIAGFYATQQGISLTVVPLVTKPGKARLDYRITMGIRFNEPDWKHQINELIRQKQDDINTILLDYGVPLLDAKGTQIGN